jgi:hypothetical protein
LEIETAEEPSEADDSDYYHRDHVALGHRATADAQRLVDGENLAALACGYGPQPAAPVAPMVQALDSPVSMNTYVELAGRQVQITLRGTDEAEVLTRLETLLQRFPVQPPPAVQAHGEGFCQTHTVAMKLNHGKDGSQWYSHKVGERSFAGGQRIKAALI